MDPNTTAAVVSACAALAAAGAAFVALPFTVRAANSARNQTDLQREVAEQAHQPYVWADVRLDAAQGSLINFVVGNSGPTIATDVVITVDPALPIDMPDPELSEQAFQRLRDGIKTLGPGRVLEWTLGMGHQLLSDDGPQPYTITVDGYGPHGPLQTLRYVVDLADFRESLDAPPGSLHQLTKAVNAIEKKLPRT